MKLKQLHFQKNWLSSQNKKAKVSSEYIVSKNCVTCKSVAIFAKHFMTMETHFVLIFFIFFCTAYKYSPSTDVESVFFIHHLYNHVKVYEQMDKGVGVLL